MHFSSQDKSKGVEAKKRLIGQKCCINAIYHHNIIIIIWISSTCLLNKYMHDDHRCGLMIALFTMGFSCEQLLSFWKKGFSLATEKPRQMGTKNIKLLLKVPFFKGIFWPGAKICPVHLVCFFMFCTSILFYHFLWLN